MKSFAVRLHTSLYCFSVIGPALPPLYRPAESNSSSEDSDPEEVVFKRAKYSGSGDSLPSQYVLNNNNHGEAPYDHYINRDIYEIAFKYIVFDMELTTKVQTRQNTQIEQGKLCKKHESN